MSCLLLSPDSAYTERYMGSPNVTDNYKGYEEGDLTNYADQLRDKQYLLIHGTADDNVHIQQSMTLAKALANRGVLFQQIVYPDENHGLGSVKRHLYRSIAQFFEQCFVRQASLIGKNVIKMESNQLFFCVCRFHRSIKPAWEMVALRRWTNHKRAVTRMSSSQGCDIDDCCNTAHTFLHFVGSSIFFIGIQFNFDIFHYMGSNVFISTTKLNWAFP